MNERQATWKCPACNKDLPFYELRVDGLIADALANTPEKVREIEVEPDGSWRPRDDSSADEVGSDTDGDDVDDEEAAFFARAQNRAQNRALASAQPLARMMAPMQHAMAPLAPYSAALAPLNMPSAAAYSAPSLSSMAPLPMLSPSMPMPVHSLTPLMDDANFYGWLERPGEGGRGGGGLNIFHGNF